MNLACEKPEALVATKTETAKQFLEEALEDFQNNLMQESLEKMTVLSMLVREMMGAIKEEESKRGKENLTGKNIKRSAQHIMWYELKEKYLLEEVKRNTSFRNESEAQTETLAPGVPLQPMPILRENIEILGLTLRSENCMRRAGIETVGQLTDKTTGELQKIRNFGQKSLEDITKKLAEKNLALRQEETKRSDPWA